MPKREEPSSTQKDKLKLCSLEVHYLRFSLPNSSLLFFIAKRILKENLTTMSQYMLN